MFDMTPLEETLIAQEQAPKPAEDVDPRIGKALELLDEGSRPTVPVKLYDDADKLYEEVLKRFGGDKLSPNAIGVVPFDKSAIYINRKAQEYNDPYLLASKLAHEQTHVKQPNYDRREHPAYEQELAFVNKYPARFDEKYRRKIAQLLEQFRKREQKSNVR